MTTYEQAKEFKKKYPSTIAWRIKSHASVIDKHLNPEEEVRYVFLAQKGYSSFDIFSTFLIALTNKRILIAQKRVLFGYNFLAITPDMFNDLTVNAGIIWGKVLIDTVKETAVLSNISKRALDEIETEITEYMMSEKQKYMGRREEDR